MKVWRSSIIFLLSSFAVDLGFVLVDAQTTSTDTRPIWPFPIQELTAQQFAYGINRGLFDVIGDIRGQTSWDTTGHVPGATHLPSSTTDLPEALKGCERCSIAIYCSNPNASRRALLELRNAGYMGLLFNAQDADTWVAAGYKLVTGPSRVPPCTTTQGVDACRVAYTGPASGPPNARPSTAYQNTNTITTGTAGSNNNPPPAPVPAPRPAPVPAAPRPAPVPAPAPKATVTIYNPSHPNAPKPGGGTRHVLRRLGGGTNRKRIAMGQQLTADVGSISLKQQHHGQSQEYYPHVEQTPEDEAEAHEYFESLLQLIR